MSDTKWLTKLVAILTKQLSSVRVVNDIFTIRIKKHWYCLLRAQLLLSQHCFTNALAPSSQKLMTWITDDPYSWRVNASSGLNAFITINMRFIVLLLQMADMGWLWPTDAVWLQNWLNTGSSDAFTNSYLSYLSQECIWKEMLCLLLRCNDIVVIYDTHHKHFI